MTSWMEELDPVHGGWRCQLRMDRILARDKTDFQDIVLFENPVYGRVLALDGVVQTTEADEFIYHEMLVHVPLLAHGRAKRVLIVGGGDGGALEEVLKHPGVETATLVEIDPGVVWFSRRHLSDICGRAFDDPRSEVAFADAFDWVRDAAADGTALYDVILQDSTDPEGPGTVLFTAEFYANCRRLLAPGGVLASQNTVPFLTPEHLTKPLASLRTAFSDVAAYRACVPSFYGGDTVFAWAGDDPAQRALPEAELGARADAIGLGGCRYWTPAVHVGAFALPPMFSELLPE